MQNYETVKRSQAARGSGTEHDILDVGLKRIMLDNSPIPERVVSQLC